MHVNTYGNLLNFGIRYSNIAIYFYNRNYHDIFNYKIFNFFYISFNMFELLSAKTLNRFYIE